MIAASPVLAQDETSYTLRYANGRSGTTVVNPALKAAAPDASKPFLLITGISFSECDKKGHPKRSFRETLQSIDDATSRQVQLLGNTVKAATFTFDCSSTLYFYMKDTADMRTVLETFYRQNIPEYPHQITLRADPKWEVYLGNLYPHKNRQAGPPPRR